MSPEFPVDPHTWTFETRAIPPTALEALMSAAPGEEPVTSGEERQVLREAVAECWDALGAKDRFILEAHLAERLSFGQIGVRLNVSRSYAHKAYGQALQRAQTLLLSNPLIRKRLNMEFWQDAAWRHIEWLDAIHVPNHTTEALRQRIESLMEQSVTEQGLSWNRAQDIATAAITWLRLADAWDPREFWRMVSGKQHDYGCDNIMRFGEFGITVRLSDKQARLNNIVARGARPRNESLIDTLLDIVGYVVVWRMLVDGEFTLPLDDAMFTTTITEEK